MNRVDLFEVVSQVARLVKSMLGSDIGLKVETDGSVATVRIGPIQESDFSNTNAQQVVELPAVQPQPVEAVVSTQQVPQNDKLQQEDSAVMQQQTSRTITLTPEMLDAEFTRVVELATTLGPDPEQKTVDLLPWLAGRQVHEIISRVKDSGYWVKVWKFLPKKGQPIRYRFTYEGSVRIFISRRRAESSVVDSSEDNTDCHISEAPDSATLPFVDESVPAAVTVVALTVKEAGSFSQQNGQPTKRKQSRIDFSGFLQEDPDPPDLSRRSSSRRAKEKAKRQARAAKGVQLVHELLRKANVRPQPDDWKLARPTPVPRKFMPHHWVSRPEGRKDKNED